MRLGHAPQTPVVIAALDGVCSGDISTFQSQYGLSNPWYQVQDTVFCFWLTGCDDETTMDTEYAMAMSKGAPVYTVEGPDGDDGKRTRGLYNTWETIANNGLRGPGGTPLVGRGHYQLG